MILAIVSIMLLPVMAHALRGRATESAALGHDRRRSHQVKVHAAGGSTADGSAQDPPHRRGHRVRLIAGDALSKAAGYGVFWLLRKAGEAVLTAL